MKLTDAERWILSNQYLLLERLYPEKKAEFERTRTIVEMGIEPCYGDRASHIRPPISTKVMEETLAILNMYDQLNLGFQRLADKDGIDEEELKFTGFDASESAEDQHRALAMYLIGDKTTRFSAIPHVADLDSHMPRRAYYSKMVEAWQRSADPRALTKDDIVRISSVTMR